LIAEKPLCVLIDKNRKGEPRLPFCVTLLLHRGFYKRPEARTA
jgi:hypothetical protein